MTPKKPSAPATRRQAAAAAAPAPAPAHKAPARKAAPVKPTAAPKLAAAAPAAAKTAKPAKLPRPAAAPAQATDSKAAKKTVKPRARLVRDSFTMPEQDFALIAALKATALGAQRAVKKSELLRAGLQALAALAAPALVAALDSLEPVKTGRPKKGH